MNSGSSWREYTALLGMMLICSVAFPVHAQTPAEPAPAGHETGSSVTNSFKLNRLQRMEDDLTRSLKRLFGGNTVDNVMTRRPVPVRIVPNQNKNLQNKNDWMNLDASGSGKGESESSIDFDTILKDKNAMDVLGKPEDQLLEYYRRQDPSLSLPRTERASEEPILGNAREWLKSSERPQGPSEVIETEEKLRSILREQSGSVFSSATAPSGLSDWTSQGATKDVVDFRKRGNPYLEEYRRFMTPPTTIPNNDIMGSFQAPTLKSPFQDTTPASSLQPVTTPKAIPLGPQLGSINPVFSPVAPPDPTVSVVNQWNPLYTPTPGGTPPARFVGPPKPTFEPPRRKF